MEDRNMKKLLLKLTLLFFATSLFAQWVPVNTGLPDYPPTGIINWVDTLVISTYGGGIYLTYDQGENWSEMPGVLPNQYVNNIDCSGGQFDPIVVSSNGGPFTFVNGGYIDCSGTGLTNTEVNFWSGTAGGWDLVGDAILGTNGGGIFAANYTSPFIYDWYPSNASISGDGLFINDGLVSGQWGFLATEGGVYHASFGDDEWSHSIDGLSGDALRVNALTYIGGFIIATDGGLYYTASLAEAWSSVIPDEKFNISLYMNTPISPSGFMVYALGENGFYTQDFVTWHEMDFEGIPGEVTAAAADDENLYVGFTTTKKDGKENGGMYKRALEDFIVGIEDDEKFSSNAVLEQNFPNPSSGSTQVAYTLSQPGLVSLKVYNMIGAEVQTIVEQHQQIGRHTHVIEVSDLAAGIYSYSLKLDNQIIQTRKMILIK